jgi:hypothetical protein
VTVEAHSFEESDMYYEVLQNLKCTTNYILQVIAVGKSGTKEYSESVRFETIGVPPDRPQRIAFQILGPGSLQVNWGEPPNTNGQILAYEVSYGLDCQSKEQHEIIELPSGHNRSLLIEDLVQEQEYVYEVRAQNEWGWSEIRRARLAIQLNSHESPPSEYVMGKTSSGILYQESSADESYPELTHKFTDQQVLNHQMRMAEQNQSMASINEYISYESSPDLRRNQIAVKAYPKSDHGEPGQVTVQGNMFGSQDVSSKMYGSTTFIQAEADPRAGQINTTKVVEYKTGGQKSFVVDEQVSTKTETVTTAGPIKTISDNSVQQSTSQYENRQNKEKDMFGTTLLTTNRQHHTNFAMQQKVQEQQHTTTTTTTTVKKIKRVAGPEQHGWDADCDTN